MASNFSKIENKEEWHDLLGKVLFKTFFHSWEWESFLESQFPWMKFEHYNWKNKALLSFLFTLNENCCGDLVFGSTLCCVLVTGAIFGKFSTPISLSKTL